MSRVLSIRDYNELTKETSLINWYRKLQHDNIILQHLIPHIIIKIPDIIYEMVLDHSVPRGELDKFIDSIDNDIVSGIGYPCFMRSDMAAAKHEWSNTCYVKDKSVMVSNIYNLLQGHFGIMDIPFSHLVFREFIYLKSYFRAYRGLPIAQEFRVFVRDGNAECIHFYWVKDAVAKGKPKNSNWEHLYKKLLIVDDNQINQMIKLAERVGRRLENYWSVDFGIDWNDNIWLIDAARGEISYHPECKYNGHYQLG